MSLELLFWCTVTLPTLLSSPSLFSLCPSLPLCCSLKLPYTHLLRSESLHSPSSSSSSSSRSGPTSVWTLLLLLHCSQPAPAHTRTLTFSSSCLPPSSPFWAFLALEWPCPTSAVMAMCGPPFRDRTACGRRDRVFLCLCKIDTGSSGNQRDFSVTNIARGHGNRVNLI